MENIGILDPNRFESWMDEEGWNEECERCEIAARRRGPPVWGAGDLNADIMIIGEAPGRHDEKTGMPFTGQSGELLDDVLSIIDIDRSSIRITNAVMCRPCDHDNWKKSIAPTDAEVKACRPRLYEEIYHVDPLLIIAMGTHAAKALLGNVSIGSVRGEVAAFTIPSRVKGNLTYEAMITWHPSYVNRKLDSRTDDYPSITNGHKLAQGTHPYYQFVWSLVRAQAVVDYIQAQYTGSQISSYIKDVAKYVV
jgi:uracil-DNA glycosylase